MKNISRQIQGDEVAIGWTIGRAPLALRGIRFAEPADPAPAAPAAGTPAAPAAPVPSPPSAPAAPAPHHVVTAPERPGAEWYHADHVKGLRGEAQASREEKEAATAAAAAEKARADAAEAKVAAYDAERAEAARAGHITAAAKDVADADMLADSQAFAAAIKDVDVADATKLTAAIAAFVEKNPRFAVAGDKPGTKPAPRQQSTPSGAGQTQGPTSLGSALDAHYAR